MIRIETQTITVSVIQSNNILCKRVVSNLILSDVRIYKFVSFGFKLNDTVSVMNDIAVAPLDLAIFIKIHWPPNIISNHPFHTLHRAAFYRAQQTLYIQYSHVPWMPWCVKYTVNQDQLTIKCSVTAQFPNPFKRMHIHASVECGDRLCWSTNAWFSIETLN